MKLFRDLDPLILKEVNQVGRVLAVHGERLDDIEKKLTLLLAQKAYITSELEEAIKKVALRASSIDQKVPDKG